MPLNQDAFFRVEENAVGWAGMLFFSVSSSVGTICRRRETSMGCNGHEGRRRHTLRSELSLNLLSDRIHHGFRRISHLSVSMGVGKGDSFRLLLHATLHELRGKVDGEFFEFAQEHGLEHGDAPCVRIDTQMSDFFLTVQLILLNLSRE